MEMCTLPWSISEHKQGLMTSLIIDLSLHEDAVDCYRECFVVALDENLFEFLATEMC